MMKKLTIAGTALADVIKRIDAYPSVGMLCKIGEIVRGVGGSVPNTGIDLKTLDPDRIRVDAIARIGKDDNGKFIKDMLSSRGIGISGIVEDEHLSTSFTDVMTLPNGDRTFFTAPAASALFNEDDVKVDSLDCDIFHIGYLLLLDSLDAPDDEYGTKMARLLKRVQDKGIRTSIDVVSGEGARFREIVTPALKYCNYVVINEVEAGMITGIEIRKGKEIDLSAMKRACAKLVSLGVKDVVSVHCPEVGVAMKADGEYFVVPSLDLPKGYIAGAVGAGDAFCAGMLYGFLTDMSPDKSLELASCTAVCNLSSTDSVSGARSLAETLEVGKRFPRKVLS
ncbi:MAG: carbohydrate kinase family protein [Candidatus Borkfalkiaceae bacterium]|nr:carbohydrate kinase family protein [Christensenellaceae bacterium]